ncbi:hypothetical protein BC941DRAFT_435382 [Chlamydoabsidia padenii]|nr:hypothetical protein BC941DRAFT_435382 [Chlamydoabsidia padenii]
MPDSLLLDNSDQYTNDLLVLDTTKQSPSSIEIQQELFGKQRSDLPLGKALHLLLHVKPTVLNTAIDQVWRTPENAPTTQTASSPVANALLSLDRYLTQHDSDSFLHHIYDPLKNKVLKPKSSKESSITNSLQLLAGLTLWSQHQDRFQTCIEQELVHTDKRGALSAALILSFITKQWPEYDNTRVATMSRFLPSLILVLEQFGELPTLLACTVYDIVLAISVYTLDSYLIPRQSTEAQSKISILEEEQVDGDCLKFVQTLWPKLTSVLLIAEKWQQSSDLITKGAWMELQVYMTQAHTVLMGISLDGYHQVRKGWSWLCKVLVSSQILSKNPTKKLKFVWKLKDDHLDPHLSSYLKILMLALRQNGYWIEQQTAPSRTADERDYEHQTRLYCQTMVKCYPMSSPWTDLNRIMIPTILGISPYLCIPYDVPLPVFKTILESYAWGGDMNYLTNIADCFLSQPDTTIPMLVSKIQPDTNNKGLEDDHCPVLCCGILDKVLDKITSTSSLSHSSICETLVQELLARVTTSNKSCELLLRCLPLIRKPALLLCLMKMLAMADNERSNHVTKGLIAKTLMEDSWCGDSLLVYIDLIRDLLRTRRYRTKFKSMTFSKSAMPGDVFHMFDNEDESGSCLDLEDLEKTETELLWPIQLWSTKVNPTIMERIIPLLIDKYYNAPNESIFIRVWQMLAFSIIQHKSLVLAIIKKCTEIMENQKRFFDMIGQGLVRKEDINLYTLLLPILVLSIFPRHAYEHIGLPSIIIQQWQTRWPQSDHKLKTVESSVNGNEQSLVFIRLADALLIRYDYSGQVIGIPQIQKLALDTLYKIFYHQ